MERVREMHRISINECEQGDVVFFNTVHRIFHRVIGRWFAVGYVCQSVCGFN